MFRRISVTRQFLVSLNSIVYFFSYYGSHWDYRNCLVTDILLNIRKSINKSLFVLSMLRIVINDPITELRVKRCNFPENIPWSQCFVKSSHFAPEVTEVVSFLSCVFSCLCKALDNLTVLCIKYWPSPVSIHWYIRFVRRHFGKCRLQKGKSQCIWAHVPNCNW